MSAQKQTTKIYNNNIFVFERRSYLCLDHFRLLMLMLKNKFTGSIYDVTLIVENIHGCIDTAMQTVRIRPDFFIAVPNTFTPDGDGLNDIFFPGALELTGGTDRNYSFYIFNRWGELINEVHEMSEGWDGTYKGKLVQNGTYVWRIEVTDLEGIVHKYTGHVNVLR